MTSIRSRLHVEEAPPQPPNMDDARRELDAAILQTRKHCLEHAQTQGSADSQLRRYLYAVTVMRTDRFYSLHSGRRSRSLTRVYVEQRENLGAHVRPSMPGRKEFAQEEIDDDDTVRLEWHETVEGRKAEVVEEDKKALAELQQHLPAEYHQWEHELKVQTEETSSSATATVWRIGDHLFSYEEPLDLSVDLPEKIHYFFTGEHLPERRFRYTSLPNLTTIGLHDSLASKDHSHHNLYGHGFRHVGNTFLSRTMESLDDSRLQIGARPSLHDGIYGSIPITAFESESTHDHHETHIDSHQTASSHQEEHYAVSEVHHSPSASPVDHYAQPEHPSAFEHANESMVVQPPSPHHHHSAAHFTPEDVTNAFQTGTAVHTTVYHHEEPIYDHVHEERIYDEVAHDNHHAPPIPLSPLPAQDDTLHYAAVAIATGDEDSHLYKDDENIYEEIDAHVIESSGYAEPRTYHTPAKEPEYTEVAKDHHHHVDYREADFSSLRRNFEEKKDENHYEEVTKAPRRKDFDYDENQNHDEVLVRSLEISESPTGRLIRDVKPYVGSPTFNKLQKKFFPEDLAERQAQRERESVDLTSPITVVTNDGIQEQEYRVYDKNQYEEAAPLVMASPIDGQTARRTMQIRRMSKNNQWSDEEESTRTPTWSKTHNLDEIIPPNSPFVPSPLVSPRPSSTSPVPARSQISPSPSARTSSVSPLRSHEHNNNEKTYERQYSRPDELHLKVDYESASRSSISPVERVVSSVSKAPHSPTEFYPSGFVRERRKIFENGSAPPLPGYSSARRQDTKPYIRNAATVRLETVRASPVHVVDKPIESVSTPVEVNLRKTIREEVPVPHKQHEDSSDRRKSVLEMRREYEASLHGSQPSTTTTSPQRSRTNSRRRTGEVQIGGGATLAQVPKETEEESSLARRTVHRTVEKAMQREATSHEVTVSSVGHGVTVSVEPHQASPSTSTASITIGSGVQIRSSPTPAVRIGAGASLSTSPVPPTPITFKEAPALTVGLSLQPPTPIQVEEVRESTGTVEEEPTPLQRNGSGRRSWTVKTYENSIRFDNQKLKMPDVDYAMANGHLPNGVEKMNGEENAVLKDWDPRPLVRNLYEVSYEPRVETKRNRFFTMEGHVEVPSQETNTLAELEREWKSQYMRTKEGRLQIFASHCSTDAPAEEIILSGCDVDANRDERTLTIHGGKDRIRMLLRVPSNVFDKWRQALLSHAASSQIDAYVKPVLRTMDHLSERVVIIEIGSCSVRGGRLTQEPSLPQSFFPALGVRTDDGKIIVGEDAYTPSVRHRGEFVRPIQASDPAVERYTMEKDVVKACMAKVVADLGIEPSKYKVLLSMPQNIPIVLISELVTIALEDIRFQGAAITRQPSLILYAYDVTTGVVVDIGDRLNIVPVIDGYVVDSAICSIPYGATQVREALRSDLCAHNKGLYSFQSPIEKLILRYVMEQACYVPEDYAKENKSNDVHVSLDAFNPTPGMPTKFNIDSSRFTCTEGLFRPKKWGLDTKGLHQLVHEAVQMSPIDARRNLYRNIYLAGGASLLPGLAEKLEQELANIVPNSIHTQVHISPWRYNAAFLGAQVVASSSTFEDQCVTAENLQKFLVNLSSSTF